MKYGYREHRELLTESLKTKVYCTEEEFRKMAQKYRYYAYDKRCKQIVFIIDNMQQYYTEPTWLFIELEEKEKWVENVNSILANY